MLEDHSYRFIYLLHRFFIFKSKTHQRECESEYARDECREIMRETQKRENNIKN